MRTEWNFKLFYKSTNDPQIDKDMKKIESVCLNFQKKYSKSKNYLNSEKVLAQALKDYEKVYKVLDWAKPVVYFFYQNTIFSSDSKIENRFNQLMGLYTNYQNLIIFFENRLKTISKKNQNKFLTSRLLKKYNYLLKVLFSEAKYSLSEDVEKVLNLKSLPAHMLWVQNNEKNVNSQIINFKNKKLPISEAISLVKQLPLNDRRKLHKDITKRYKEVAKISEPEINAILLNKKINDDLRGFSNPFDSRILNDQNDKKTVEILTNLISENFKISHDFYKLKAKLIKLKKLKYEDWGCEVGKIKTKYSFSKSVSVLSGVYKGLNSEYENIFSSFLKKGQIDVKPKKGKPGGAFCSWTAGNPTMVLLNHVDNSNSLITLAHEMGHAIHSEFSKKQPPFFQHYTTSTAEVASTCFENIIFDHLYEKASKKDKIILLHNRINGDIATIFRQIAFFNFEKELHITFREKGGFSKEDIASLLSKHLKSYLGPVFDISEDEGYSFVYISHFRNFFYVYNYAYGQLISRLMSENLKNDKGYIENINKFLHAGGSQSPKDIFKSIGIDTTKTKTWEQSLDFIKRDIKEFKKLING